MSDYDPTDIAAHEAQQEERKERDAQLIRQSDEDLKAVMSTIHGRRFVAELLGVTGLYRISYAGDNNRTNFNEGQRNIGLRYHSRIEQVCPELYMKLLQELNDEREQREQQ